MGSGRRRALPAVCTLVFLLTSAPPLTAQDDRPPAACAFDTTAVGKPGRSVLGLGLRVPPGSTEFAGDTTVLAALPMEYLLAADAIRREFTAPQDLALPLWSLTISPDQQKPRKDKDRRWVAYPVAEGELVFHLTAAGRVTGPVTVSTGSPTLDEAFVRAVHRADSTGSLPVPSDSLTLTGGRITLAIGSWCEGDRFMLPLLRLAAQLIPLDAEVRVRHQPTPAYPLALRGRGKDGRVVLSYVVNGDGTALMQTVRIEAASDLGFIEPTLQTIATSRYHPAKVKGCAVPQLVSQVVQFKVMP